VNRVAMSDRNLLIKGATQCTCTTTCMFTCGVLVHLLVRFPHPSAHTLGFIGLLYVSGEGKDSSAGSYGRLEEPLQPWPPNTFQASEAQNRC
jgi:hypothetical protein